jgi:hypothetical protein
MEKVVVAFVLVIWPKMLYNYGGRREYLDLNLVVNIARNISK